VKESAKEKNFPHLAPVIPLVNSAKLIFVARIKNIVRVQKVGLRKEDTQKSYGTQMMSH